MALPGVNPTYKYLDDSAPDGVVLGKAASVLIGFWGATPSSQRAATNQASITATATSVSATIWGYATSAQAQGIVTLLNQIQTDLVALGIIKGTN